MLVWRWAANSQKYLQRINDISSSRAQHWQGKGEVVSENIDTDEGEGGVVTIVRWRP
jgi:hypothetical protein